jgi:hypothetical protein
MNISHSNVKMSIKDPKTEYYNYKENQPGDLFFRKSFDFQNLSCG